MVNKYIPIKATQPWVAGDPVFADRLEAMRSALIRFISNVSGFADQFQDGGWSSNLSKERQVWGDNQGSSDIPEYSIFGIKEGSTLTGDAEEYNVEIDTASPKKDYLFTNDDAIIPQDSGGWVTPVGMWQPVLVRYTGTAPAINDKLEVADGVVKKDGSDVVAVSNPDTERGYIWVVKLGGGGATLPTIFSFLTNSAFPYANNTFQVRLAETWMGEDPPAPTNDITVLNPANMFVGSRADLFGVALEDKSGNYRCLIMDGQIPRVIEFDTTAAFATTDAETPVNPTNTLVGPAPGATVTAVNTKSIFFANDAGFGGVAIEDLETTEKFNIVQLKCEAAANQSVMALSTNIPSYDDTDTHIPFDQFEYSSGNLISINVNGEIEFNRDTRGAIRFTIGAFWSDQLGVSASDQSLLTFELDQGSGFNSIQEAGISLTHTYLRIPPNNYILGGSTSRNYWSSILFLTGWKVRIMARSALGTIITSLQDLSVELIETYDAPIGP